MLMPSQLIIYRFMIWTGFLTMLYPAKAKENEWKWVMKD